MSILNEDYVLNNGVKIPKLALGTWLTEGQAATEAVKEAIKLGYRHIDTAQAYGNETEVGLGLRESGKDRQAIFVTTKLAAELKDYDSAAKAIDESLTISNVTFEPGCRNNWHVHHAKSGGGQVLICVDGEGWYQEAGKPAQSLHPGDIVEIPAGVKHWHGAKKDQWFSHLAFEIPGVDTSNEWLEPVTDKEYNQL